MKNVLVVAYYFPPHATVGALRPLGFCRYLEQFSWIPHVVSTDATSVHPPCPIDQSLCQWLPEHIRVSRIPYVNPATSLLALRTRIRCGLGLGRNDQIQRQDSTQSPQGARVVSRPRYGLRLAHVKNTILDWVFDSPDPQKSWFRQVISRLSALPFDERPDLVFATGSPWTSLLIGRELSRRWKVPFVADFRDPWASDSVHGFSSSFLNKRSLSLEASVCLSASAIVTNTEELRQEFLEKFSDFGDRVVTITNGFNFDNRPNKYLTRHVNPELDEARPLELCHFGNVYGHRNADTLLRAVAELHEESRLSASQFRIRFVGSWEGGDTDTTNLVKRLEDQGLMRRDPPIPHQQCLAEMAAAQVLLIVQPHSSHRVPAKTYEYIASGRPILLVGEEGAASRLIEKYRLGRWCPSSVPVLKKLILSILDGTTILTPPSAENIQQFDYKVLTGQLVTVFDKAMEAYSH